ncbi:MAG TPA: hypothetical protein PLN48_06955, partial [Lachnospiraceae bacterium]|nr:hypothetical protein [Lachnospiraceae bacterium]
LATSRQHSGALLPWRHPDSTLAHYCPGDIQIALWRITALAASREHSSTMLPCPHPENILAQCCLARISFC